VLLLQYGQVSFLFPGDVRTNAALALQTIELPKGCLVLKVPHHGLASSTSPQFIEWADPELAVISCSVSDDTGPVAANLCTADVPFLTTSANGTIPRLDRRPCRLERHAADLRHQRSVANRQVCRFGIIRGCEPGRPTRAPRRRPRGGSASRRSHPIVTTAIR
jgi:hypothetical protein